LDDFGTGYSSVALLRDLNIHTIKIDLSFTRHMVTRPRDAGIVRGLVAFCRQLGIDVVAEGVESLEQVALLKEYHCPNGQGFLYGRPGPIERLLPVWLKPASVLN
jgi:EAL domain-containing protein (putative c-di-GMP-specific phosphodiesterase class I)